MSCQPALGKRYKTLGHFWGPTAGPKPGVVGEDQLLAVGLTHRSVGDLLMFHSQP